MRFAIAFPASITALALYLVASRPIAAQPVFERPDYAPGDMWQFQFKRESDGTSGRWRRTIDALVSGDRFAVRHGNGTVEYFDRSLNFVGGTPEGDPRELVRFPLKVGDSWTFTRRFADPGAEDRGSVTVAAYERITVPAGTFDCFRLEATLSAASASRTIAGKNVRWYCPEIKWFAKEHFEDLVTEKYVIGSRLSQTSELIRYRPAPGLSPSDAGSDAPPRRTRAAP